MCTAALFLSGYAIQQRTVRDLRAAIRPNRVPRASPKVYAPDPSEKRTVELEDGTVVDIEDAQLERNRRKAEDNYIIVRPSLPGEKSKYQKQAAPNKKKGAAKARAEIQNEEEEAAAEQKPISRAERRRQIKEEIRRLSEGQEPVLYQRRLW